MTQSFAIRLLILFCLTGCQSTFGPVALENTHPAYNQAIVKTQNEQMLLNLVRVKYLDKPFFLKIGSITASLTFDSNVGLGSDINLDAGGNILKPSLGIGYADKPTISFQPLGGEDFLKSVLSSISFDALLVMTQSGWSIERVFGLCVERLNDLHNAPTASGPTPAYAPEYKEFKRAIALMRSLQLTHDMEIGVDKNNLVNILFRITPDNQTMIDELSALLKLKKSQTDHTILVKLANSFLDPHANELKIRPRSIASVLYYLAQNVRIPQQHIDAGLVTVTKTEQGNIFDWSDTPAGVYFDIQYSKDYPSQAFLAVPYRDYWFYIADNDLKSKSTFTLLTQLFDLQAGQTKFTGPTLTLPVR